MLINLNARRAAQSKTRKEPVIVLVGDKQYELARSIPLKVMEFVQDSDFAGAAKSLLANPDRDWEAFSNDVHLEDLAAIISSYGSTLGESEGSADSSTSTGEPSAQTSGGSTVSASPTPATPPTP